MFINLITPLLLGLAGGWAVNYLADVLPRTRQLTTAVCPRCQSEYTLYDFLFFRACRTCNQKRSVRTWFFQFFLLAASLHIWNTPPQDLGYWYGFILLIYFATVFVIDLEHRLILHPTSMVGAALGLGAGWLHHGFVSALTGGLVGFGIMYMFYLLGVLFAKARTRRRLAAGLAADDEEALGFGDVILAAILGLALGWPLIWICLLIGTLLGGLVSILLLAGLLISGQLRKKAWDVFLPYGPYFLTSASLFIYVPTLFK